MSTAKKLERKLLIRYIVSDLIAGTGAYTALHLVRKLYVEPGRFGTSVPLKFDQTFILAAAATTALFIGISALSGIYRNLTRKSRLAEAFNTFGGTIITAVLLFFLVFLSLLSLHVDSTHTTVTNLNISIHTYQTIIRFQITMHNIK